MIFMNLMGLFLIGFIVTWFWLIKPKAKRVASHHIQITVKAGVYSPARIEVNTREPIVLEFLRQDASACSEWVNFERLDVHEKLPFNQPYEIALGQLAPGVYPFSCQMRMYLGELIVIRK